MMSMPTLLDVEITKSFPGGPSPFHLDVNFQAGAGITVLFGPSGAGKTAVLNAVAGVLKPDAGRIAVGDVTFFNAETKTYLPSANRRVGYVFQGLALFPHLTVAENVGYGLGSALLPSKRKARRKRVNEQLASLHLEQLADRRPDEISGGQQQRVALARALIRRPRVLLLDEPLTGLDLPIKQEILSDLRRAVEKLHIPALFVTHDAQEAARLGDSIILLEKGRIISEGEPMAVLKEPTQETVARLADAGNILDVRLIEKDTERLTQTVEVDRCRLRIPLTRHSVGSTLKLAVPAGDILVATVKPDADAISARNVLAGKIVRLAQEGYRVTMKVDCGTELEVRLTPGAVADLALEPGKRVWLIIKAFSCHVLESP